MFAAGTKRAHSQTLSGPTPTQQTPASAVSTVTTEPIQPRQQQQQTDPTAASMSLLHSSTHASPARPDRTVTYRSAELGEAEHGPVASAGVEHQHPEAEPDTADAKKSPCTDPTQTGSHTHVASRVSNQPTLLQPSFTASCDPHATLTQQPQQLPSQPGVAGTDHHRSQGTLEAGAGASAFAQHLGGQQQHPHRCGSTPTQSEACADPMLEACDSAGPIVVKEVTESVLGKDSGTGRGASGDVGRQQHESGSGRPLAKDAKKSAPKRAGSSGKQDSSQTGQQRSISAFFSAKPKDA